MRVVTRLDVLADRDLVVEASSRRSLRRRACTSSSTRSSSTSTPFSIESNASSIPIMRLGTATRRPSRVMGIHFFNPVLALGELVPSLLTLAETSLRSRDFVTRRLGKQVIPAMNWEAARDLPAAGADRCGGTGHPGAGYHLNRWIGKVVPGRRTGAQASRRPAGKLWIALIAVDLTPAAAGSAAGGPDPHELPGREAGLLSQRGHPRQLLSA